MTTAKVLGYLLGPPICASAALVLLVLALHAGRRDRTRAVFLQLLLALELWLVCTFLMRISPNVEAAVVWDRLVGVWILALFVTYFHFCYVCTGGSRRWPVAVAYVFFAVAASVTALTDQTIERMTAAPYGYAPVVGPLSVPFFAGSLAVVGAGIFVALRAYRAVAEGEARNRFLYLAVAGFLPLIGIGLDGFTDLPPVAIWTNLAFSAICMVAVLKYRLLHIRIVAKAGVIRLVVSTLVAIPYVGALAILSMVVPEPVSWWLYAAGVLLFALLLRPLYGTVQELIDRLFYGERYDHLLALRNFSRETGSAAGLGRAGSRLTELLRGALRASSAALLQPGPDDPELAARDDADAPRLAADGPIALWLQKHRAALSDRALATDPELRDLPEAERQALQQMGAVLLAPVFAPQGNLTGVIVLGPKTTGRPYTTEDLHLLETAGTQAAMALETGRLYADAERSRRTLEAWLQSAPDAVLITDAGRLIRFANRAAEERFGVRRGQVSPVSRREASGPMRFHDTILGREYDIACAPLLDSGGVMEMIWDLRDITERREHEAARTEWERRARITAHLASIGEMAAGIAHEINNPLTAVIGYSGLLAAMPLGGQATEAVSRIVAAAERVAGITQRLLTFARQQRPERRAVSLNEIIRSTIELRSYSFRTSNVQVVLDLDERLPDTVADAQQMQQVFLNLIINAESAMKSAHAGGLLTIRTRADQGLLRISVADDGPGVPLELRERIFDPFFTTKEVGEGSGLGLSICHGIVSEHGGRIGVRAARGGGAEFVVEVPLVVPDRGSEAVAGAAAPASPAKKAGRILAVDDEPAVRDLLVRVLTADGHRVDTLADGRSAVECILANRYDIILLDVRMPGMSGLEVFEQVRRKDPSLGSRIVFMTGDVMAPETLGFVDGAGARCVTKPFDFHAIQRLLREMLGA